MLEELFLVRHAAPDRSLNIPYYVPPGPPLAAQGHAEAAQAAAWLAARGIEQIIASPFERTSQTAAALAEWLGLDLTFTSALQEGAPGEPFAHIRARVTELLAQLDDGPLRRIALVTHGACVRALLLHTTNDRIDLRGHAYDNGNCAPTAGIWRGVRAADGWQWTLAFRPAAVTPAHIYEPGPIVSL